MKNEIKQEPKQTVWPVVQWFVLGLVIMLALIAADYFGLIEVVKLGGYE